MDLKFCRSCSQEKLIEDFAFKCLKTNKRHSKCKKCQQEYCGSYYKFNKVKYLNKSKITNKIYKKRNKEFLIEFKQGKPCSDCSLLYPHYVMDFDHDPKFQKKQNLSDLSNLSHSILVLQEEIEKCELVCSNCHRIRTWNRLHQS